MNTVSSTTDSKPEKIPQWQEKSIRKLTFTLVGIALVVMIAGTVIDRWIPTPGRNAFGVVLGLFILIGVGVRHAYLRGVADAAAHTERHL